MHKYYDKAIRSTASEDRLLILQFLKGMIGQQFEFLNYFKEIPLSYNATLLNVEKEMAEFAVHEYQATIINIERRALVYCHHLSPFNEDIVGDAFYVNTVKKRAILCRFAFAHIRSDMRNFVRVQLDHPVKAYLFFDADTLIANIKDISLSGASIEIMSCDLLEPGVEMTLSIKLPDHKNDKIFEIKMNATVVRVRGEVPPYYCIIKFQPEKHSQQQIAYYINQRQLEIIKELKDITS